MKNNTGIIIIVTISILFAAFITARYAQDTKVEPLPEIDEETASSTPTLNGVTLRTPQEGATVRNPLVIEGEVDASWVRDGSFSVTVRGVDDAFIARKKIFANAATETPSVSFKETLFIDDRSTRDILLIFAPDSSNTPDVTNSVALRVVEPPRVVTPPAPRGSSATCRRTGCSGQICSDSDIVSTCEYRPEYACYEIATCERQESGECGWTPSPLFQECIASSAFTTSEEGE